jgi:hypothetical protein
MVILLWRPLVLLQVSGRQGRVACLAFKAACAATFGCTLRAA